LRKENWNLMCGISITNITHVLLMAHGANAWNKYSAAYQCLDGLNNLARWRSLFHIKVTRTIRCMKYRKCYNNQWTFNSAQQSSPAYEEAHMPWGANITPFELRSTSNSNPCNFPFWNWLPTFKLILTLAWCSKCG
jgi:hypothetical protein